MWHEGTRPDAGQVWHEGTRPDAGQVWHEGTRPCCRHDRAPSQAEGSLCLCDHKEIQAATVSEISITG